MSSKTLRLTIIALLFGTGIFHFAVALAGSQDALRLPLTVFGFLYTGLSFYVRRDTVDGSPSGSRNAIIAAMAICSLGLVLGGRAYLANGAPPALLAMLVVDVVIIAAGAWWLFKAAKA